MKKILVVLAVLVLLVAAAAAIFVATFDANRYKGLIVDGVSKALGRPVELDRVGLGWRNGVALEIAGLTVYSDDARTQKGLSLASAGVGLKLLPLLQKNFQFTSIVLERPDVLIERRDDGTLLVGGVDLSKKSAQAPASSPSSSAGGPAPRFSVDSVSLKNGRVVFKDRGPRPMDVEISDIDVTVKSFSLERPFDFQAAASVFSGRQNLRISGKAWAPQADKPAGIQNFSAATDLSDLDYQKVSAAFPSMGPLPFKEKPKGRLEIGVERLDFDPASVKRAKAEITLKEGRILTPGADLPVDNIDLRATLGNNEAVVDHLTAQVAGGEARLESKTTGLDSRPVTTLRFTAKNVSLADVMKATSPSAPQLTGHLGVEVDAQSQGAAWPEISGSMNGRARLTMNDGVILNYNILQEIIQKLSVIPGAEDAFKNNFPKMYQKRLEERSTLLKPLDISANIVGGTFIFDSMRIETDFALIDGSGQLGLDRRLSGRANLILNEEISKVLAGVLPVLEALYNNGREVVVPVGLEGQLPQVKIVPDRQYLMQKLLSGQTQELVQGIAKDPAGSVGKIEDILKKNLKGLKI